MRRGWALLLCCAAVCACRPEPERDLSREPAPAPALPAAIPAENAAASVTPESPVAGRLAAGGTVELALEAPPDAWIELRVGAGISGIDLLLEHGEEVVTALDIETDIRPEILVHHCPRRRPPPP